MSAKTHASPSETVGSSKTPPCIVCGQRLRRPLLLPCLHTACYACVTNRLVTSCPACGEEMNRLPDRGSSLTDDHFMRHLLEVEECCDSSVKPCDYCNQDNTTSTAVSRCLECCDNMCTSCIDAHRRTKITRNHQLLSLKDLQNGHDAEVKEIRDHQTVSCHDHVSEPLRYYCIQCEQLVCRECKVTDHEKHSCSALEDTHWSFEQKTLPLVDDIKKKVRSVDGHLSQMKEYLGQVNETRAKLASDINSSAAALHEAINQHRDNLLTQLNQALENENKRIREKQSKTSHLHRSLTSSTTYVDRLFSDGKPAEILSVRLPVKERLTHLLYRQVEPLETKLGLHFTASPAALLEKSIASVFGKVEIYDVPMNSNKKQLALSSKKPELSLVPIAKHTPILNQYNTELIACFDCHGESDTKDIWPTGVAVQPDTGLIYVVDRENCCVKVWESPAGRLVREFGRDCLRCPYDITVLKDGNLAVTDHQEEDIKIFTLTGELIHTVKEGIKYPRGLTTDHHGNIIVVDAHNRQLRVIDPNKGKEVKVITGRGKNTCDLFNEPYYITVNRSGFIIVTDWASPHIKWFSPDGVYMSHYGDNSCEKDQLQPYGICVDQNGCILVADNQNHRVHLLTPEGKFSRFLVTKQHGLWHPMAITINKQGHLVVTEALGKVKVFKYM